MQGALWLWTGLPLRPLVAIARKLATFLAVLVLCLGFSGLGAGSIERWIELPLGIRVSADALAVGGVTALRILTVVVASSLVQRTGEPDAIARGLSGLGVPRLVALTVDATLAGVAEPEPAPAVAPTLGPAPRGGGGGGGGRGGGGGGGGGGRRREAEAAQAAVAVAAAPARAGGECPTAAEAPTRPSRIAAILEMARRFRRGEGAALLDPLGKRLQEARRRVAARHPDLPPRLAHDVPVLASIGVVMLGVKVVKVLPGLPFAPGFKGAVFIPCYVLARDLCRSRLGASALGTAFGSVSFLFGDGKFGIFEVAKHAAPGLAVDLTYPVLRPLLKRSRAACCVYGALLGATRLSGELLVAWLAGAPDIFYAYLGFAALTHVGAGGLSGFVTFPLLQSANQVLEGSSA